MRLLLLKEQQKAFFSTEKIPAKGDISGFTSNT